MNMISLWGWWWYHMITIVMMTMMIAMITLWWLDDQADLLWIPSTSDYNLHKAWLKVFLDSSINQPIILFLIKPPSSCGGTCRGTLRSWRGRSWWSLRERMYFNRLQFKRLEWWPFIHIRNHLPVWVRQNICKQFQTQNRTQLSRSLCEPSHLGKILWWRRWHIFRYQFLTNDVKLFCE